MTDNLTTKNLTGVPNDRGWKLVTLADAMAYFDKQIPFDTDKGSGFLLVRRKARHIFEIVMKQELSVWQIAWADVSYSDETRMVMIDFCGAVGVQVTRLCISAENGTSSNDE